VQANGFSTRYADGGGGAAGIASSPGSTSACRATSGSPEPTRSIPAASRFGRSDLHADDIDADPGAPRWNLDPHRAGCRQMVLTGGQRDRAALLEARTRSLGGLAALPAILSGGYQIKSYPRSRRPSDSNKGSNDDQLRRPIRQSRAPSKGLIKVRSTTLNEHGETIQVSVVSLIVARRNR